MVKPAYPFLSSSNAIFKGNMSPLTELVRLVECFNFENIIFHSNERERERESKRERERTRERERKRKKAEAERKRKMNYY